MTSVVLPFLLPMLLGRTIDLRTYSIGGGIYDYANYVETPVGTTNSTYHVLQGDSFPFSYYGVPVDVALRIKSDYLTTPSGVMGLSGFLKDTSWKYNSVVVGLVTVHKTVDRTLKDDAPLISDWKSKIPSTQTHFGHSISYGGWTTILFKFQCDVHGDVQAVRKTLTDALGVTGTLDDSIIDLWKKAMTAIKEDEDIRGQVKITTAVYSTFELPSEVTSLESYLELIKDFPKLVTSSDQPLYMTLKPLSELDEDFDSVEAKYQLTKDLQQMDDMFDDVKITKESLVRWTTETSTLFSDEDEERIYSLLEKINSCIRSFRKVNEDVSLFKDMDIRSLELSFHTYLIGLERGIGSYNLAYLKLREEIDAACESNFLHKIKGLLRVSDNEKIKKGTVEGGLEECQKYCIEDKRCRAVGYSNHISELDMTTDMYFKELKQCWIYYRSTNTASVYTPDGISGDLGVYDRKCYL